MFAARGVAVSFSIFFLLYSGLSLLACLTWRRLWVYAQRWPARSSADLLFMVRMLPLGIAAIATLVFAVPSFLLLEPRAVDEPVGAVAIVLGCCGMSVLLSGVWNAAAALSRAARTVAEWSSQARCYSDANCELPVSVMRTFAAAPPLTAAGILRPTVWLSGAAEFVLTERELRNALRHEMIHVRQRDNLRKLVLRVVAFPGMAQLENAWREATEMAADDAAVSSASEALDLAAAVIKLSRLAPLERSGELTTALVHSPAESVNARVERLIGWTEERGNSLQHYSVRYTLFAAAAVITALVFTYGGMLVRVHAATEWLVR